MKLHTKYFGEIEYLEEDLLHFTAGPFGFEEEREFLLLPFEGSAGTLLCFQSTRTPALAFVAMDPFALLPEYAPVLQPQELEELGVASAKIEGRMKPGAGLLCVVRGEEARVRQHR